MAKRKEKTKGTKKPDAKEEAWQPDAPKGIDKDFRKYMPEDAGQFDWSSLFVPSAGKLYRFLLILGISAASYGILIYAGHISTSSVSSALWDLKILLLLLTCYLFASYADARRISLPKTALLVLVPELAIVFYLLGKVAAP